MLTVHYRYRPGRGGEVRELLKIQCSRERSLCVKGKNNSNYAEDNILKTHKKMAPKNRKCKTKTWGRQ
jgi:hypothetical protein